ncbi:MAG: hypothetical protein E7613_08530 [Ruminococcaceae bacterium]|nr:hypothetical protein [Oscillospiraceae bacterium]
MKKFCFTVDDNIRFLKEITERNYTSIFDHPYLGMYKRLHEKFNLEVQLNLFYFMEGFELSQMSDKYKKEWTENSHWLKLSFHSLFENVCPYENSDYNEVFTDCNKVNSEILRFASPHSLAKTTTVHFCVTTSAGLEAVKDNGYKGLLGLFGDSENPRISYSVDNETASEIRKGKVLSFNDVSIASIDMVINTVKLSDIPRELAKLLSRDSVRVMIHEQYFYEDYTYHQSDFEEKLNTVFSVLTDNEFESCFFEELIEKKKI